MPDAQCTTESGEERLPRRESQNEIPNRNAAFSRGPRAWPGGCSMGRRSTASRLADAEQGSHSRGGATMEMKKRWSRFALVGGLLLVSIAGARFGRTIGHAAGDDDSVG